MNLGVRSTIFGVSLIGGTLYSLAMPDDALAAAFLAWPVPTNYTIACDIGCYSGHKGIDIGVNTDNSTPIYASADGEIVGLDASQPFGNNRQTSPANGNYIKIKHDVGGIVFYTYYLHLANNFQIALNQKVNAGTLLGYGSNSGMTCGSQIVSTGGCMGQPGAYWHLHFEVQNNNGQSLNPLGLWIIDPVTQKPISATSFFDVQGTIQKVQSIYNDILGRSGDAAAIEKDVIPLIRSGSKTLDDIRREVASSDEAWNIARKTYLDVLGRTGDEVALRSEITKYLASGISQATIRRNVAKTREVLDLVKQLYIDVLGRSDVSEDNLWKEDLELLATGQVKSLSELRAKIAYSNFQGDSEPVRAVQKIYRDILGREGNLNDIKQYTVADLASGKTTILKIRQATADSPEAKGRINAVFQAKNGRLPFPLEMKRFTDALVSGATISDVEADIQGIKQLKGFSALSPLLPQFVQDGWKFFTDIASGLWVDPPTKKGFQYEALGTSIFTGINDFPNGIDADDTFSVFAENQFIGRYQPGQSIDFVSIFGKGVKSFSVTDIESNDPNKSVVNFALPISFGEDFGSLRMRADDGQGNVGNPDKPEDVPEPVTPIATIVGLAMILKRFTKKRSREDGL